MNKTEAQMIRAMSEEQWQAWLRQKVADDTATDEWLWWAIGERVGR